MRMHECIHIHASACVCAHVCCDMPISSTPSWTIYPSSIPPSYCPIPDPTLLNSAGPAAKTGMRGGTVFQPCGGQSLWIHQSNLGPSPLGSCAQQAPFSPPEDGGLWNESPDSRPWRHAFVLLQQGGIDDWLHLCVCERATPETLSCSWENPREHNRKQPCCVRKWAAVKKGVCRIQRRARAKYSQNKHVEFDSRCVWDLIWGFR